jgi:hypothetical protein
LFTAQLRSNKRGANHRKHRSSMVARVRFRWNVFTETLPSIKIFQLLGVMSQYVSKGILKNILIELFLLLPS